MTVLFVQSYGGAESRANRHYGNWVKSGFPVVAVNTVNRPHAWPIGANVISVGEEAWFGDGDKLARRYIDILAEYCCKEAYSKFSHVMLAEQDCVFIGKPPPIEPEFMATLAGHCPAHWNVKAKSFYHPPYWMSRNMANRILETADELLDKGEYENGSPDVFFGRIVDLLNIRVVTGGTWCCNSEDLEKKMPELRAKIREGGIWFVHGVRTADQFSEIIH